MRGAWTPWLVLAGSLALTVAAATSVAVGAGERDEARFENVVQTASDRIAGRLEIYIAMLRGGAALFAASDSVSMEDFRQYVERLDVQRRYPGIQGIGWTQRLARGLAGPVDEVHAIQYLEPLDERNRAAIGFDMYSEPVRRVAMQRARDQADPAMSGRVTLVQEIIGPQQPGFLIYVPVYAEGTPSPDVAGRREALLGFVYSPFRAGDLFQGIFGTEARPRVRFSVFDGEEVRPEALLHSSAATDGHRPAHATTQRMQVAGHHWTVLFESLPEFERTSAAGLVPMILLAGLLASFWMFGLAVGQAKARTHAEIANQAKGDFLATMSHELRTPLNAISGYVDLMALGIAGPITERQKAYLGRIRHAQHHLLGLINDVLNFAKLEAGRVEFRREPFSVADLVEEALSLVTPQAEERWIAMSAKRDGELRAEGDREKALQILLNLLTNAVKFTEPGGRVAVDWRLAGSMVEIGVQDTGIGIAVDRLESIFEPFLQLDADLTRDRPGTGLGLSISRELARGMGGEITVRSTPGMGSTFSFTLPRGGDGGREGE